MSSMEAYLCAAARRLFRLAPIDRKKVVFCSYYGKGYSDSPKAIAEALLASGEDLKLVWLLRDPKDAAHLPEGISPASYRGIRRVWELSTAAAWVDNCRKGERCKRKGQYYLQTWHGFALKRIEQDAADALEPLYVRSCIQDSAQCDLMVSGSGFMTRLYQRAFWYQGSVAEYGTPRNDVFFSPQPQLSERSGELSACRKTGSWYFMPPHFAPITAAALISWMFRRFWRLAGTGSAASGPGSSVCIPTWRSALRDCLLTTAAPFWTPRLTRICRSFYALPIFWLRTIPPACLILHSAASLASNLPRISRLTGWIETFTSPWIRCPFPWPAAIRLCAGLFGLLMRSSMPGIGTPLLRNTTFVKMGTPPAAARTGFSPACMERREQYETCHHIRHL